MKSVFPLPLLLPNSKIRKQEKIKWLGVKKTGLVKGVKMISWNIEFLELKPSIARPKIFWTKISAWDNDIFSLDCLDLDSTLASRVEDLNIDKFWPVLFVNKWFEITFPFWAQQYLLSKIQQNHALVSPFFQCSK